MASKQQVVPNSLESFAPKAPDIPYVKCLPAIIKQHKLVDELEMGLIRATVSGSGFANADTRFNSRSTSDKIAYFLMKVLDVLTAYMTYDEKSYMKSFKRATWTKVAFSTNILLVPFMHLSKVERLLNWIRINDCTCC